MTDFERYNRMLAVTPNASQTRSKAPGKVGPRDRRDGYPLFLANGEGCHVTDLDGREYLDFIGANAAIPLGYNYPAVTTAVAKYMGTPLLSMPSMLEAEVVERLRSVFPCCQQARFVKTGSEACTAALAIAREATCRNTVWVGEWAYHGWHEWARVRPVNEVMEYGLNDWAAIERLAFRKPAAVFFEPPRWQEADPRWLHQLVETARDVGAVVVFDEMVQAFRLRAAGGMEHYAVVPDLACIGKALGNGFPIAAVIGPTMLMRHATGCVSSTHGGERIGLAAANAVLDIYNREPILTDLWASGRAFWDAFTSAVFPPTCRLEGTPVHFRIRFSQHRDMDESELLDKVLVHAAGNGVLFHRDANNASAVMSEKESAHAAAILAVAVDETIHATKHA